MKARDARPGDVVKVRGRKVTVDRIRQDRGMDGIEWSRGTASGVTGLPRGADVQLIYRPKLKWKW